MIGIVESGATKTQWVFIDKAQKQFTYRTPGFSPTYQSSEDIAKIIQNDLLPHLEFKEAIGKIYYYGAGCEAAGRKKIIADAFKATMPSTDVIVNHDLYGAAKALFGDKPGIACISGTGSNTCYYDGKNIVENVYSPGLFLGDEGSGGYVGKLLISKYLRKALPDHLLKAFEDEYPDRADQIMNKVYKGEMPSRYLASFAPFAMKHINDPEIYKIVYQSFDELFDNCIVRYKNYKELPIGFVGSIAYHFKEILDKVAESKGAKIAIIDPDPSKALVQYHLEKFLHEHN